MTKERILMIILEGTVEAGRSNGRKIRRRVDDVKRGRSKRCKKRAWIDSVEDSIGPVNLQYNI